MHVDSAPVQSFGDIPAIPGPRIIFHPSFAVFPSEIALHFPKPDRVFISSTSTLVIKGNVIVYSLHLDGALRLEAAPGTRLEVYADNTTITNKGHTLVALAQRKVDDTNTATAATTTLTTVERGEIGITEIDLMRGYKIKVEEEVVIDTSSLAESICSNTPLPIEFVYNSKSLILKSAYESVMEDSAAPVNECRCFGIF